MKSLVEYIKSIRKDTHKYVPVLQSDFGAYDEFLQENHLNDANITERDIDVYMMSFADTFYDCDINEVKSNIYNDLNRELNEMLNSVSSERIIKEIGKKYNNRIACLDDEDDHKKALTLIGDWKDFDDSFSELVKKFNYYISVKPFFSRKYGQVTCVIEPKYADIVTNRVWNDYDGVLYHYTDEKNFESIMKSGLRLKKGNYREFENRCFLFGAKNEDELNKCISYLKKIKPSIENPVILKIQLDEGYDVDFYQDTMMGSNHGFFCYTYAMIPPKWIENVTKEFLKK